MTLQEIGKILNQTVPENYHLYFISRIEKDYLRGSARRKAVEKFNYKVYSVDINNELRDYVCELTKIQINCAIEKNLDLVDYDYISDDTENVQTYSDIEKITAFMKIVNEQLPQIDEIPLLDSIGDLLENGALWAYCIEIEYENECGKFDKIQAFRKILLGNIAVDSTQNNKKLFGRNILNTVFSTTSKKLEVLHGETIKLDKRIDSIYIDGTFYILDKKYFEQTVGLGEVIKEQALEMLEVLENSNLLVGIEFLRETVESNTAIHKKLVKIRKIGIPGKITSNYSAPLTA